eukprot:TRINITY_DN53344_c0_g1_i1.p1 TRINITY_DN53344_c0_g1~~TRINITY_DN53344_c0_g1_i1.p1  ORF type:complete len:103 (-),score=21.79 TRINITY_DN53344_c0_g1_i1:117-425(-)
MLRSLVGSEMCIRDSGTTSLADVFDRMSLNLSRHNHRMMELPALLPPSQTCPRPSQTAKKPSSPIGESVLVGDSFVWPRGCAKEMGNEKEWSPVGDLSLIHI